MIRVIFGQRGAGKTTLARHLTQKQTRLLVLDPNAEYRAGTIVRNYSALLALHDRTLREGSEQRYICRFESDEHVSAALAFCWELRDFEILAEEADLLANPYQTEPTLSRMIRHGRHRGISITAVSRRPAEVSRMLTSQAEQLYSFRQEEPADLEYLKRRGFDPEQLQQLAPYEFVSTADRGKVRKLTHHQEGKQ